MAHFAKVLDGNVINVIVAEPEFFDTFIDTTPGEWIQTSYNTKGGVHYNPETKLPSEDQTKALRWNFASIGGTYDAENDAFIDVPTYQSWVLDENFTWQPPTPYPDDGGVYDWNEETQSWDAVTE